MAALSGCLLAPCPHHRPLVGPVGSSGVWIPAFAGMTIRSLRHPRESGDPSWTRAHPAPTMLLMTPRAVYRAPITPRVLSGHPRASAYIRGSIEQFGPGAPEQSAYIRGYFRGLPCRRRRRAARERREVELD